MSGVFGLTSSSDLFQKLEWEFEQLSADPTDAFKAYNFFVTAWHLLEWVYPDPDGEAIRIGIRNQSPELQICERLAVGAKHFEPRKTKLKSVVASQKSPGAWGGAWGNSWGASFGRGLFVTLQGAAKDKYGEVIEACDLARHVMTYWRAALQNGSIQQIGTTNGIQDG